MKRICCILLMLSLLSLALKAEIRLPSIFGDNMLLQQNTQVNIWGWADKGEQIVIKPTWTSQSFISQADAQTGKWHVSIPTPVGGYNTHSIAFTCNKETLKLHNVLVGEVWLCSGQSNMEMPMKGFKNQPVENSNLDILHSKNSNLRLITVKRNSSLNELDDFAGEWLEATPPVVKEFSATAYYYGRLLQEMLDVPVGLINVSWGGSWVESWMSKKMLQPFSDVALPQSVSDVKEKNRTPTTLFNGMISPIVGYTIKGAIWYQGESNYDRANTYTALFTQMVKGWRQVWNQGDFPFYFCQTAPYNNPAEAHGDFNGSFLREAQAKSLEVIPNSGMAVLMDVGEEFCIHPRKKKVGGERLALLALGKTYEMEGFAYESPSFKEVETEGSKMILTFHNAPMWLTSYGQELSNFEIAGSDKKFYPAKAEIHRSKVEVSSPKVKKPIAVRYAFKDFVKGDLFGTEGLPISCFRTDNWDE